jgi:O-antigen ligase
MGAAVYVVSSNPNYVERWNQVYYEGNVSGRDRIYSASIDMALERPVFGWHPVLHWYELGSRLGKWERDEHSLILHLLLEVGTVGMIPFLVGLWLCGKDAWSARKGKLGGVPLALFLAALVNNVTDTGIAKKTLWFILALTLASASKSVSRKIIRVYSTNKVAVL